MSCQKGFSMTIANGATESAVVDLTTPVPETLLSFLFVAPTLATTVTVHVAAWLGGTFAPLQSGGADVTLASAKATALASLAVGAIKLVSGSAVSGDKVFQCIAK